MQICVGMNRPGFPGNSTRCGCALRKPLPDDANT